MDKNAIKRFAIRARRELIERVTKKALQYGNTAEQTETVSINGRVLSDAEAHQRKALLQQIHSKGYEQVIEEVAYTWFNRFCALRFMEVNQCLPSRVRVFTNEEDKFVPQMLTEALNLELEGLERELVYDLKEANDKEGLFKYLLITQCNALNPILPGMFQRIADYTELLFPDNLLREGSVIHQLVTTIPAEDWLDAVQIIGWLYQYYNSEKKDEVFAALKKNVKITKDNIPAATQIFTPDWIVRYMVENALGRLWVEGHPDEELKKNWHYYLEEAQQTPEVQAQLANIRKDYAAMQPEDIKCIDPCMGSGHILAYMFDVLMQIYDACGYSARDAVRCIVEKNLYGLDIDDRAAQLAYFAVMMKARQYDRRFLTRRNDENKPDVPQPKVYAIQESNAVSEYAGEYTAGGDEHALNTLKTVIQELHDAKQYGSLLQCSQQNFNDCYALILGKQYKPELQSAVIQQELLSLIQVAELLSQQYDIVITNPPYMGSGGMNAELNTYVKNTYPDSKADLFSAFMTRCLAMCTERGKAALVTMQAWMFLSSFELFRKHLLKTHLVTSLLHMESMVMGINFGTSATVFAQKMLPGYISTYNKISIEDIEDDRPKDFPSHKHSIVYRSTDGYEHIPGAPVAYWASPKFIEAYKNATLAQYGNAKSGLQTGNNDEFLRYWHEVELNNIAFCKISLNDYLRSGKKWTPQVKGGSFRKWYGNFDYVVNWQNNGEEIRNCKGCRLNAMGNNEIFFNEGITWSHTALVFGARYLPVGHLFNVEAPTYFAKDIPLYYVLAFLNSVVAQYYLSAINATLHYLVGNVQSLPLITQMGAVNSDLVISCIDLARKDWDDFEISWDFKRHPLFKDKQRILESYKDWEAESEERFCKLKANEEELNRIFIDIYGLQDELTPEVEEKVVTVRKADLGRDIRSLISYAVGCMFGRYSLDVEGLAYAGGEWDASKYCSFPADKDNIIPICDDEYFEDDIVGRFVEFIRVAYGAETLEENLRFIADALGGKGSAREVIRKYFRDDFYADHLKIYQKRPIYWQFDSGKKGGFRALVYMHRYAPDTIARIRTDYVHEQQSRFRTEQESLVQRMESATTGERVKLSKRLKKLQEQDKELHEYEEKIHHLADQFISLNLDDGVKKNYALFSDVLTKIK